MQKRKKLLKVLKSTLLTFREATYDIDLAKVAFDNGVLCLYPNRRSVTAQAKCRPLPSHLTANKEHKEAALAHNSRTTVVALLGRLTRKLLAAGTTRNIRYKTGINILNRRSSDYRVAGPLHPEAVTSDQARPQPRFWQTPSPRTISSSKTIVSMGFRKCLPRTKDTFQITYA